MSLFHIKHGVKRRETFLTEDFKANLKHPTVFKTEKFSVTLSEKIDLQVIY